MTNVYKISGALALMTAASVAYAAIGTPHSIELGYLNEGNLMRPGNIIHTLDYSAPDKDATACRESCRRNQDCEAFTYAEPKDRSKGAICYHRMIALPNGAKRDHPVYDRVISGTAVSYFKDILKQGLYGNRVVLKGEPISEFRVASDDTVACADACYRDGNCDSWTYAPHGVADKQPGGLCRTYSGSRTLGARQGYISGTVKEKTFPATKPNLQPRRPTEPIGRGPGKVPRGSLLDGVTR